MVDGRPIPDRATDLDMVEAMIDRIAIDDTEASAARRVFGLDDEANRLAAAYSPEPPPPPVHRPDIDHAAHTREAITRYQGWVDSHPDDDPTPLRERERILHTARLALRRLEAKQ